LEGREERQLPQAEKAARADSVIHNNGSVEDLEREVAAVLQAAGTEAAT
jgi:dephospho-CoA kinase